MTDEDELSATSATNSEAPRLYRRLLQNWANVAQLRRRVECELCKKRLLVIKERWVIARRSFFHLGYIAEIVSGSPLD